MEDRRCFAGKTFLTSIGRLVDRGLVRPHLSASYPLERLADAHRQIETGRTIGKLSVVVRPSSAAGGGVSRTT